jgi:hypothetical protein
MRMGRASGPPGTEVEMPTAMAEEIVRGWWTEELDGWDNPAGPLFPSSDYAPAEITMTGAPGSKCSSCTASQRVQCC